MEVSLLYSAYDGGNNGDFRGDAGRNATGIISTPNIDATSKVSGFSGLTGVFTEYARQKVYYSTSYQMALEVTSVLFMLSSMAGYPTAAEFRVASIGYSKYIIY